MSSLNVDLATALLTSHAVRSLLHLSGNFSCDYCVLNGSLCVVLCGVLCLVAIIQSISSGLLNPLFFDYNFFAYIVPTDNTANY